MFFFRYDYICDPAMEMIMKNMYDIYIYHDYKVTVGCQRISIGSLKQVNDEYYKQLNNKEE